MKVKYVHLDRRITCDLENPASIKDSWGTPWEVESFRVEEFTGKSVRIRYINTNKMSVFGALKRLTFHDDGKLSIKICGKDYFVGTWEIKEF